VSFLTLHLSTQKNTAALRCVGCAARRPAFTHTDVNTPLCVLHRTRRSVIIMENSAHLAPTSATEIDQMSDADIALLWKQVGKSDYTAVHWRRRPMMRSLLLKKLGLPDDKGSGGGTARPGSGGATEVASTPTAPGSGGNHADGV
jgi:hypothetical protein